jgi:methionyl-tRNA formyltransferase
MKVIAFVDHEIGFRLLERMLAADLRGRVKLRAVVTSRENGLKWWPGVAELARQNDLPLLRYPLDASALQECGIVDHFFLLSWKHLLPPNLLAIPRHGAINLHYSLLPKYRGVYPVNWAIIRGERRTGVTFHLVGRRIDDGPVLCQADLPIQAEDTARTLQLRLDDLAVRMFEQMLGQLPGSPEKSTVPGDGNAYFSRDDFEATNEIDLQRSYRAGELIDLLRGKTFLPHGHNAYFIDPHTGRKIQVSLILQPEPPPEPRE